MEKKHRGDRMSACKNCGVAILQQPKQKPKKFCGDACRLAWWGENRDQMHKRAYYHKVCQNCGAEFEAYGNEHRKYCSRKCFYLATQDYTRITEQLSCAEVVLLEREGQPVRMAQVGEELAPRRVYLMRGVGNFNGKIDHFSGLLPPMMQENLQLGDGFVFCNKPHDQLAVMQWQGNGFVLLFKRLEELRWPWPREKGIKIVEITPEDLQQFLDYPNLIERLNAVKRTIEKLL
jgi:hypothetical protein